MQRRSNGSSALNTSTASSESVPEDCDNAEILGAKRYRSQQKEKNPETIDVAALLEVIVVIYLYILYFIFTNDMYIYRKLRHLRLSQGLIPPLVAATALCCQAMQVVRCLKLVPVLYSIVAMKVSVVTKVFLPQWSKDKG